MNMINVKDITNGYVEWANAKGPMNEEELAVANEYPSMTVAFLAGVRWTEQRLDHAENGEPDRSICWTPISELVAPIPTDVREEFESRHGMSAASDSVKDQVRKAMGLIQNPDPESWEEGMAILARLVDPDWKHPLEGNVETLDLREMMRRPDTVVEGG